MNEVVQREDDDIIDLAEVVNAVFRHLTVIVLSGIVFGLFGFVYSMFIATPLYSSEAMMIVNTGERFEGVNYVSQDQLNSAQTLVETYSVIITSDTIRNKVMSNLKLDEETYDSIVRGVSVSSVNDTQIMRIKVTATSAEDALNVCREVTRVAPNMIVKTAKVGSVEMVSEASTTGRKVSPSVKKYTVFGCFFGMAIAGAIVVFLTLKNNKVMSENDFKQADIALLGIIPFYEMEGK